MVKVTYSGEGNAHFGGIVFKAGQSVEVDASNPRLDYFSRHKDFVVEGAKAAASTVKAATKKATKKGVKASVAVKKD